jgi:hypothetical protein
MVMNTRSPLIVKWRRGASVAALAIVALATGTPTTLFAAPTILWVKKNSPNGYGAPGTSCNSPGFATIQAAINAASAGDTVSVCPGSYVENVAINKASLAVTSTGGAAVTIVRSLVSLAVFTITQPDVTLDGFTIVPAGLTAKYDIGVNVAIEGNASAEIAHNVVVRGRIGVNLGCSSSASTIYHNIVRGASDVGINIDTCEIDPLYPGSSDNSVHHNTVCGGLQPYSIAGGVGSNNNHVHHNTALWIYAAGTGNHVHNNVAEVFDIAQPGNLANDNTIASICP